MVERFINSEPIFAYRAYTKQYNVVILETPLPLPKELEPSAPRKSTVKEVLHEDQEAPVARSFDEDKT